MTVGSSTKASWADPVKRARRMALNREAAERKVAEGRIGRAPDVPHQVRAGPVSVEQIPRDPIEVAIFGEAA